MSYLNAFVHESLKIVDENISDLSRRVLEGFPQDHAAYREIVGELRALSRVRQIFEDAHTKVNNEG